MIVKARKYPKYLKQLEALQRRLFLSHPKYERIKENYAKRTAGYKGEQSIDYSLSFLDDQKYHILHDVRLFDGTHYFQIDTLILSRQYILILEVKNISGTLFFDTDFNQLIRIQDDKREAFPDPLLQMKRQSIQLRKWLRLSTFRNKDIPIESLVILSSSRTIIETSPHNQLIYNKVIHCAKLPFTVSLLEKSYKVNFLTDKQLFQLSHQVIDQHIPLQSDILTQFKISKEDLIKGVICSNCHWYPLQLKKGKWSCTKCHFISKDAHLPALDDYFLLIDSTITNKQIRDFLLVPTTKLANRILTSSNLHSKGINKGRMYFLKDDSFSSHKSHT